MTGAAAAEGLGLSLNISHTGPAAYSSPTELGAHIVALRLIYEQIGALACTGANLATGIAFDSAQGTVLTELTGQINALIDLDIAQIAYEAQVQQYVAEVQAGTPASTSSPGATGGSTPGSLINAGAPEPAAPGLSTTAVVLIATASLVVGGSIGYGVGRHTKKSSRKALAKKRSE